MWAPHVAHKKQLRMHHNHLHSRRRPRLLLIAHVHSARRSAGRRRFTDAEKTARPCNMAGSRRLIRTHAMKAEAAAAATAAAIATSPAAAAAAVATAATTASTRPRLTAPLTFSHKCSSQSISCDAEPPSPQCKQTARAPSGSSSTAAIAGSSSASALAPLPPPSAGRLLLLPLNLLTCSSLRRVTT